MCFAELPNFLVGALVCTSCELADNSKLLHRVIFAQLRHRLRDGLEERPNDAVDLARQGLDDDPPTVTGVLGPLNETCFFEPIDDARDGAGREPSAACQLTRRDGAGTQEDVCALV